MKKHVKLFEEYQDQLPGGEGDDLKPSDVCKRELALGVAVEKEHSGDDSLKTEIALDHLTENPTYYSDSVKQGVYKDEQEILDLYKTLFSDDLQQYNPNKQQE